MVKWNGEKGKERFLPAIRIAMNNLARFVVAGQFFLRKQRYNFLSISFEYR